MALQQLLSRSPLGHTDGLEWRDTLSGSYFWEKWVQETMRQQPQQLGVGGHLEYGH